MHSEQYATKQSEDNFQILNGNGGLIIYTMYPEANNTTIDETLIEEMMTPQRPDDLRRISLKTLKIENSIKSKDCYFITVLQPIDASKSSVINNISVKRIKGDNCFGIEITSAVGKETFLYSKTNQIAYGDSHSRSKWISTITNEKGEVVKTTSYPPN